MDVNMDKSLIEKLKDVIRKHHLETGERVESVNVDWRRWINGYADIENVSIRLEK